MNKSLSSHRKILAALETSLGPALLKKCGLQCRQLTYGSDSEVLYITKPAWSNRFDDSRKNTVGIFCSIWVTPALINKQQFSYNIHSKKLRELEGHRLTSIKFAQDFRHEVRDRVVDWPNIKLDHGPTTLLDGFDSAELDQFSEAVTARIDGFVDIHGSIDTLLQKGALS